jgi:hypothetical protein
MVLTRRRRTAIATPHCTSHDETISRRRGSSWTVVVDMEISTADEGHLEVARLLLHCGAEKDAADQDGDTPLTGFEFFGEHGLVLLVLFVQGLLLDGRGTTLALQEVLDDLEVALPSFNLPCRMQSGCDCIDVPTKWTHRTTPSSQPTFSKRLGTSTAVALHWQYPLVPFNKKPGDLVQQVAEATHAQMGLQG